MPLTFPSHAAAVIPLHRAAPERLWLVPLVVGSGAPDLAYALRVSGAFSHSALGVLAFCVPVGLAVYAWLEWLVLPALRLSVPHARAAAWLATRGPPATLSQWAWAAAAVALGAATHALWDGFTHAEAFPARALYGDARLEWGGLSLAVANALQYASTLAGALFAGVWWARRPRPRAERRTSLGWGRMALLCAAALAGAIATVAAYARDFEGVGWKHTLWLLFFLGLRGIAVGLTPACGLLLALERRRAGGRFVFTPPPRA